MHRKKLLSLLEKYKPYDSHESEMKNQAVDFITREADCFDNFCKEGHITASSWLFDKKNRKVGLIHHKLVNKWLPPGGHSDGRSDTPREALREAQEEFGIEELELSGDDIFDIDVHLIKEDKKRNLGEHFHFDFRFLVFCDSNIPPHISNESHDAGWIDLDEIGSLNNDEAMRRLVTKTERLIHMN